MSHNNAFQAIAQAELQAWTELRDAMHHVAAMQSEGLEPDVDDLAAVADARSFVQEFDFEIA